MSTNTSSADYGRFEQLAEEFAARLRRGERPALQEYIDRCPDLADEIRELFPALFEVERVKEDRPARAGAVETAAAQPPLDQVGDYRVLREIGRGGMGVVYEAEQVSLGRRVALKVLPRQAARDGTILERFRREARAAARLHHTNIVPVYEVGQDGDIRFYAMQFIQGQGLDSVIDELRRLSGRLMPAAESDAAAPRLDRRSESEADRRSLEHQLDRVLALLSTMTAARTSAAGLDRRSPGGHGRPAFEDATIPDGVEVSRVVRSILVGRFGPDSPATAPVRSSEAALSRAVAAMIGKPTDTLGGRPGSGGPPEASSIPDGDETAGSGARARPSPESSPSSGSSSAVLPGGTQLSTVESGRRAFYRSLAHIGRQVAGGLAYAHARGVVHRDIKPSNLILDTDGVAWIADFGLAKGDEEGLTQSGDILGTLRYMAPERFRGQGEAQADIYALGLTLYELLVLRPAFVTSDRLKLIERIKTEDPPRPRALDPRIPRDLETIVLKAIEKDPRARYQTAEAIGEDLRRFLADEPILARQITAAERYWRWARRNPVIAVLGGMLTAVLVAATVASMVAASQFRASAGREKGLAERERAANDRSRESEKRAIAERDRSRRLSAGLALDKGIALADEGHADRGLLWMLEALRAAPDHDEAFRTMVRRNLAAWLGQVHQPLAIIPLGERTGHPLFRPDGMAFATAYGIFPETKNVPVRLWDTATGRRLGTVPGCFFPFAFLPDGKSVVAGSGSWDRVLAVDLATGRELWSTPPAVGDYSLIVPSPDGSSVLTSIWDKATGSGTLMRWDAATGRRLGGPIRIGRSLAMAPDGRSVATDHVEGGRGYIDLLEWPSARRIASWPASVGSPHHLVISPDGRSLYEHAVDDPANAYGHFGRIWELGTRRPISPLLRRTAHGTFTPACDRVLTGAGGAFVVREAATGRARGTGPPVTWINVDQTIQAVHPDGRTVVSIEEGTASIWRIAADAAPVHRRDSRDPATEAEATSSTQPHDPRGFRAALGPDGRIALTVARGPDDREVLRLFDPIGGRPIGRPARHLPGWTIRTVALSADGRRFASASYPPGILAGEVRLWDTATGRPLLWPMPHTNYVSALAFRPDGRVLAAGDYHGLVRLWDTDTGREVARPLPQNEIVVSLAYSPDGRILAAGLSHDHTHEPGIRLWDAATRRPIGGLLRSDHVVNRIEFRPDCRVFVAGDKVRSRLWDAVRGQAIGEPIVDEAFTGFRGDGRAFLTLGRDGSVKLRDGATAAILRRLLAVPSPATCAAFRGDGDLIAVGCEDGTIRLCDPVAALSVGPPRSLRHPVHGVAFTADGRSVVAVDDAGESGAWPIPEPLADTGLDDLTLRIEARTGLRMEAGLSISRLDNSAWRERLEQTDRLDAIDARPDDDPSWHEPMVREAEQVGNAFAAAWHLDRLIAARPDDALRYARRARARSALDRFDEAAADYRRAERLGPREAILDFQAQHLIDCTAAGRWDEALWYADRLVAARPDDGSLREDRAAIYAALGREADRLADLARAIELGADKALVLPRAEQLARAGRWGEAARRLDRCARTSPLDNELALARAIAWLKAGDRAGYHAARAAAMSRRGAIPPALWDSLSDTAILALGAGEPEDDQRAIDRLEGPLRAVPAPPPIIRSFCSTATGAVLLRAGRLDEAIARLDVGAAAAQEAKLEEFPQLWAYQALARVRKGNPAEARRWLERLRRWTPPPGFTFWDLHELALLRDEAESLILDAGFPSDPLAPPGA